MPELNNSTNIIGNGLRLGPTSRTQPTAGANTAYLTVDKENATSDASVVLRDTGAVRAEIGLVTDDDLHLKTVTGTPGSEVFTDAIIVKNAAPNTGNIYMPGSLGVGTVPAAQLHVAGDNTSGRITGKLENTNVAAGSVGAQFNLVGNSVNWAFGTDVGLNGGNNLFFVNANGAYMTGFLVNAAGQVGVLTDSPGAALDVNGTANFRSTVALSADPTTSLQAATKQYVDNTASLPYQVATATVYTVPQYRYLPGYYRTTIDGTLRVDGIVTVS